MTMLDKEGLAAAVVKLRDLVGTDATHEDKAETVISTYLSHAAGDVAGLVATLERHAVINEETGRVVTGQVAAMRRAATALPALSARKAAEAREAAALAVIMPFAEAADDLDEAHKDGSDIWESPAAMNVTAGHLRAASAFIAARSLSPIKEAGNV